MPCCAKAKNGTRPSMPDRRSNRKPASRSRGRVKAVAAEGGGAPAPALTRPQPPRNPETVRLGLTITTVAPLAGGVRGGVARPRRSKHRFHRLQLLRPHGMG